MSAILDKRTPEDHPQNVANTMPEALGLEPPGDNYVQRALDHLHTSGGAMGLTAAATAETPHYTPDPHVQQTTSGARAVHLQQQYKGIAVFQAAETVRFGPDGTLQGSLGSSKSVQADLPVLPQVAVTAAVQAAATYLVALLAEASAEPDPYGQVSAPPPLDITGFSPEVTTTFSDLPNKPTALAAGPFGDQIRANLIWFPLHSTLRLGWEMVFTLPRLAGQYRVIADATSGDILYCADLVVHILRVTGNVYRRDGSQLREMVSLPLDLAEYDLPLDGARPAEFPDAWVTDTGLAGNCVTVQLADGGPPYLPTVQPAGLTFDPAAPFGDEQKLLNLFYYTSFMHDFFYLLGFREADGNFQLDDFGRGGIGGDRVTALVHAGTVTGTANMLTPVDGTTPTMNMGVVTSSGRHTAFDASVVFHEFTHGVTNRLVGGPQNSQALEDAQSAGMGEGWSDYIACTITGTDVVGAWVIANPQGIRSQRYTNYQGDFGSLGQGHYTEMHYIGEIWCATLLELNAKLGKNLALQLVVDALKLAPANPSFLDIRTAILLALDHKRAAGQIVAADYARYADQCWAVFARRGMGPQAGCQGATLLAVVPDFTPPAATPAGAPVPPAPAAARNMTGPVPAPAPAPLAASATTGNGAQPVSLAHILALPPLGPVRRMTVAIEFEDQESR